MRKTNNIANKEQGFASIVITLVLIIVLALLTVGFAQLARREQQSALDKQLAVQANYAAESGINDAYNDVLSGAINAGNASDTDCMKPAAGALTANNTIDSTTDVSYTCLLVDLSPPDIEFTNLSAGKSQHISFSTSSAVNSFTVGWGSPGGNSKFPNNQVGFPTAGTWSGNGWPAVLQVSITPLNDTRRAVLIGNSFTAYLYPTRSGSGVGTYDTSAAGNGPIISAKCDPATNGAVYPCQATINGFAGFNSGPFLVTVLDYYDTSNIKINGTTTTGVQPKLSNGQVQIDVTGKARNVLKRLQERLPVRPSVPIPPFAVDGQNICERVEAAPSNPQTNPAGSSYDINSDSSCSFPLPGGGSVLTGR